MAKNILYVSNSLYGKTTDLTTRYRGQLLSFVQGQYGQSIPLEIRGLDDAVANLTGISAVTGHKRDMYGDVTAIVGAFVLTDPDTSPQIAWTIAEEDTGQDGEFDYFLELSGGSQYLVSHPVRLVIKRDPAVNATPSPGLVSVTTAQKALLATIAELTGLVRMAGGVASAILIKLDGTTAPGVNDDSGDGYTIGSIWIDTTNDNAYIATDVTVGAANWEQINGAGGGAGDMTAATYDPAGIAQQVVGLTAAQTMTGKTAIDFTNNIDADRVHKQVRNDSGGILAKGTAVYASGYNAGLNLILVDKADASDPAKLPAIGLLAEQLANNATGKVITIGDLIGLDTSAFLDGAILFVPTTGAALFTATRPTGTASIQTVATVIRVHPTSGVLNIGISTVEDLPNLAQNNVWVGNASGVAEQQTGATARASLGVLPEDAAIVAVSGARDLATTDAGKILECTGTFTITCPNGISGNLQCAIMNIGSGVITLAATTTLTTKNGAVTLAEQYGGATVYHAGSNVWRAFGDLS